MNQAKVRIVGSKEFCVDLLEALRVMAKENGWKCAWDEYTRATSRYSRETKANYSIYLTLWRQ